MRITGGTLGGRVLAAPAGNATRPTSDRVRQAVFNILEHHDWGDLGDVIEGRVVLDAFCGTGALALEGLSRGATQAVLFDTNRQALTQTKENAAKLGVADLCDIQAIDATQPPVSKTPCQLVFLDPPYRKNLVPLSLAALARQGWIAERALIVAETAKGESVEWPEGFVVEHTRDYGDTTVHFVVRG